MTLPKSYYTVKYQTGNGLKPFRGPAFQRGYGLGGFFKGLARSFAPVNWCTSISRCITR